MEYFQIESYESFLRKNDEITDYCTEQKPCEVLGTKLQSSKQYVVGSDVTIRLYWQAENPKKKLHSVSAMYRLELPITHKRTNKNESAEQKCVTWNSMHMKFY